LPQQRANDVADVPSQKYLTKAPFVFIVRNEPVQKSVTFVQALAVSQAKALRNVHF
jgi:hypothetical protein